MAALLSLQEAVKTLTGNADTIAVEGFTHLIPFAAGHELIRQERRNLTLIRMTPDLVYDQMIGAGLASKLVFSWGGNPGVGSLHRLRDAVESEWPHPLEVDEHVHADMASAYEAGASGLPCAILRSNRGVDLPSVNGNIRSVECPFTGETLCAVPSLRPDVGIIHAQRADRRGNVHLWGIIGVQKEVALASRRVIVTVEEIVDELAAGPNAVILPGWAIDAVCLVPGGARPSYAHGYYDRSNAFYKAWDDIARDRSLFQDWINRHIRGTEDFAAYEASVAAEASHG